MAAEYSVCVKCSTGIFKSKFTGRAWQHIDYRQQDHTAVPVTQVVNKTIKVKA